MLGLRAVTLARSNKPDAQGPKEKNPIPYEGIDLREALRSRPLSKHIPELVGYVRLQMPEQEKRIKAAHDLFYLVTMFAGLHLQEFNISTGFGAIKHVPIRLDGDGKYRADLGEFHDAMRAAYPHLPVSEFVNAKLKCAANAHAGNGNTNLEYFGHAAINAAYEHYNI